MSELLSALLVDSVGAAGLGVLAILVWRLWRSAPVVYGLALLALVKLVTPPLLEVPISIAGAPELGVEVTPELPLLPVEDSTGVGFAFELAEPIAVRSEESAAADLGIWIGDHWPDVLLALWALGALVVAGRVFRGARHISRLLDRAAPAPASLRATTEGLCRDLGLRRVPRVVVVEARISPSLFALTRRPVVVLPLSLLEDLTASETRAVLAHELCHLANRDHVTRWLETAVAVLHWWNPVAYGVRHLLREMEELRCDARAVALLGASPRRYGHTILKTTAYLESAPAVLPLGASGIGGARSLKRRLTMIAEHRLTHRLAWPAKLTLSLGAACLLPLGLSAQEHKTIEIEEHVEAKEDVSALLKRIEKALQRVERKLGAKADAKAGQGKLRLKSSGDSERTIHLVRPGGGAGAGIWVERDAKGLPQGLPKELLEKLQKSGKKGLSLPQGRIMIVGPDKNVRILRGGDVDLSEDVKKLLPDENTIKRLVEKNLHVVEIDKLLEKHGLDSEHVGALIRKHGKDGNTFKAFIHRGDGDEAKFEVKIIGPKGGMIGGNLDDSFFGKLGGVHVLRTKKGKGGGKGKGMGMGGMRKARVLRLPGGEARVEIEVEADEEHEHEHEGEEHEHETKSSGDVEALRRKIRALEKKLRALKKKLSLKTC